MEQSLQHHRQLIERIERITTIANKAKAISHYYQYDKEDMVKFDYHYSRYLKLIDKCVKLKHELYATYYVDYAHPKMPYVPQNFDYDRWIGRAKSYNKLVEVVRVSPKVKETYDDVRRISIKNHNYGTSNNSN